MNALFLIGTFLFLALPFIPSFIELFTKSDTKALRIPNSILRDPREKPENVFWHLAHVMGVTDLEQLKNKLGASVLKTPSRIASTESLSFEPHTRQLEKILSFQSIDVGAECVLNEIHAQENLTIGDDSKIGWWASGKKIFIGEGTGLPGKTQAKEEINLNNQIQFHLLSAPTIRTADGAPEAPPRVATLKSVNRLNILENHTVTKNSVFHGDLIIKGNCVIEEGATVDGSIKVHGNLEMRKNSCVTQNAVGLKSIKMEEQSCIQGVILSNGTLKIASGCTLGTKNKTSTFSAKVIILSRNITAHGTLRAWKEGRTEF